MSDTPVTTSDPFERPLTRREVIKRGAVGTVIVFGSTIAFAPKRAAAASTASSITIGTFQDNALSPIRDYFNGLFTKETGIKVRYHETSYNAWYQNAKNDGLNKTGAYDIYVMDDNWVPEFAAGKIIQNLDLLKGQMARQLTAAQRKRVTLEIADVVFPSGVVGIDVEGRSGSLVVQHYLVATPADQAPLFELRRDLDQPWFDRYLAQCDACMKEARPW